LSVAGTILEACSRHLVCVALSSAIVFKTADFSVAAAILEACSRHLVCVALSSAIVFKTADCWSLLPFWKPVAVILTRDDVFNVPFPLFMKAGAWL